MRHTQLLYAASAIFASSVGRLLLRFVISLVIARSLGPRGQGQYALALQLPLLLLPLADLGLSQSTVLYVAQRRYPLAQVVGTHIMLSLCAGCLFAAGTLLLGTDLTERALPGITRLELNLALLIIPLTVLLSTLQSVLAGAQKFRPYSLVTLVYDGVFVALIIPALVFFKGTVADVLAIQLLALAAANGVAFSQTRMFVRNLTVNFRMAYLRDVYAFGFPMQVGIILLTLADRADIFLINTLLGVEAVGYFALADGIVEKLGLISLSATTALFPQVAAASAEGNRQDLTPLVARTVLGLTGVGAVGVGLLSGGLVVTFYAPSFQPAVELIQIMLVGTVAYHVSRVLITDVAARGRPWLYSGTVWVYLIVSVGLKLAWIPPYRLIGAAWATTISALIVLMVRAFVYQRVSGNSVMSCFTPQAGDWLLLKNALRHIAFPHRRSPASLSEQSFIGRS